MALKPCKECGSEISTNAVACPKCGATQKETRIPAFVGMVIIFIIFVLFLAVFGSKLVMQNTDTQAEGGPVSPLTHQPTITIASLPGAMASQSSSSAMQQMASTGDEKPVTCEESDQIDVSLMSKPDIKDICNAMVLSLGHAPLFGTLTKLSKAVAAMQIKGDKDSAKDISYQFMNIVEARGQTENEIAMQDTFEVVFRMYEAWNGHITPKDINVMLRSHEYGFDPKKLPDKGLVEWAEILLEQKKDRGE